MTQDIYVEDTEGTLNLSVQGLREIKKSRRTVMLDTALSLPVKGNELIAPLTPPLSDRASRDMAELYSPEKEEHYESIDLLNEYDEEWNQSEQRAAPIVDPEGGVKAPHEMNAETPEDMMDKPALPPLRTILESAPDGSLPRESCLPSPPPMTIHDFWVNVVRNYKLVHRTMPAFLFHKIRDGGVPSVLRRVVWTAMMGVTPEYTMEMTNIYTQLEAGAVSGWDRDIGRDLNRTWPEVEMFKEQDGEGQRGLRRVLGGYSVWDDNVGYCQGLGFLAGPLLMHTSSPAEAFTLLTVLMSQPPSPASNTNSLMGYSLRTLYTPNFPGLLSLIHAFNSLLHEHFPTLSSHLASLGLTTELYAPPWFLSMFAVTGAPIESILLRIWDLLMMEGSNGGYTMVRVGLALMKLNQDALLELTEMEDGLKFLLSKDLWAAIDADNLIGIAGGEMKQLAPNEKLTEFDVEYHKRTSRAAAKKAGGELQAVVGRFIGRLKATASQLSIDTTNFVAPPLRSISRASFTSSPQDMVEQPHLLRAQTEGTLMSRSASAASFRGTSENERALHGQIEELVRVLGDVQRRVGQAETERDSVKVENTKLRELLTRVAGVIGNTTAEELNIPEGPGSLSTLSDEISDVLSSSSSPASSVSCYPESVLGEDFRTQLTETQHILNQERQANVLLQQQLSTTEMELARTRTALFEIRSRCVETSSREQTSGNHSPQRSPTALRELKLVVKTKFDTTTSTNMSTSSAAGSSAASAGGSWTAWFGRT